MDLSELRFDDGHTWVRQEGEEMVIGITDYAQGQLGDIIFIELPEPGTEITRDETFGSVESAKAVEELSAPIGGKVARRNDELLDMPETANEDPYGEGWLIAVKPEDDTDMDTLLTLEEYQSNLAVLENEDADDDDDDDEAGASDDLFFDEE